MPIISDEAVRRATGRDRKAWFAFLDKAGAKKLTHKEIARKVAGWLALRQARAKAMSKVDGSPRASAGWWSQMVAVEYERARGLRELGETKAAGFEVGVSKTIAAPRAAVWKFMMSPAGKKIWMGGAKTEVRTQKPGEKMRLSFQPKGRQTPSTLQLYVLPSGKNKTSVHFHEEKLPDSKSREVMRAHWKAVAAKIDANLRRTG